MKVKSLILFIIFSIFLISCESKNEWINPYDHEADQAEISKICSQYGKECGIVNMDYKGFTYEMDCGKCNDGYECFDNTCRDIDECEDSTLNDCKENSLCANEEGTYSCICKDNYSGDDCIPNTRTKECVDLPDNAEWNSVSEIMQTWDGEEWSPSNKGVFNEESSETECRYKCKANLSWNESKSVCEGITRSADCDPKPTNSVWNDDGAEGKFTQTWNGEEWEPANHETVFSKTSGICLFKCAEGFYWDNNSCEIAPTREYGCTDLPANAEWNSAETITQTFDGDEWVPTNIGSYNETASTSECRFKCKTNYFWENDQCENPCDPNPCNNVANSTGVCTINGSNYLCECNSGFDWSEKECVKPSYCSAIFNGSTSKIEVAHNNALNLAYNSWTIEAWIKQPLTADVEVPIVAKQNSDTTDYVYSLSHYYREGSATRIKGSVFNSWREFYVEAYGNLVSNSGNWTHVALVQAVKTSSDLKKLTLSIYINGQQMVYDEDWGSSNQTPFIATSTENLIIGSNGAKSFNGSIGSIKISKTARYSSNFTPSKLSADSNTIAFWDFNGNADDSSGNKLHGTTTDVTYSTTDCE